MKLAFFKDKRVTVTGGSGFIGTHFVEALLAVGAKVRVPLHVNDLKVQDERIETVRVDLADQSGCREALEGSDCVIHAAGAVSAAGVTTGVNPMSPITTNLNLTAQVIEACWAVGVERMLVFGSSTGYPVTEHPVKEEEMWSGPTHDAYFGYGWMRRYIERMCEFVIKKSDMKVALVRPTATYGPWDDFDPKTSHVIPALIRRALDKESPYVVWGTGEEVRDFLYVKDLIRGCLLTLAGAANCDPINIGYGQQNTIKEIVNIILEETGHTEAEVVFDSSKPTTIPKRMVDTTKARELLQFEPQVSLREGMRETIRWYESSLLTSVK